MFRLDVVVSVDVSLLLMYFFGVVPGVMLLNVWLLGM